MLTRLGRGFLCFLRYLQLPQCGFLTFLTLQRTGLPHNLIICLGTYR